MKKIILSAAVVILAVACNNNSQIGTTVATTSSEAGFKTAYIDTEKLMKEYKESADFEAKYEAMSKKMQEELERDMKKFQNDVMDLQKNAQSKGMEWAVARQKELEKRERTLAEKQQNYMKKFQEEGSVERDSMVSRMKDFIKEYGKEKGYDYIYGTGDAVTVLYAKEQYNITDEIVKLLNEKYEKGSTKTEEKKEESTEIKVEETKK
ncbi:OmpH family outer membrane protein [Capnocytophaga sp. ARDL2]|uniref:OmpH family outer membrane protein n=1 Tax=Capnocytophaga sp. ARDL2 TaxID=3238809 RepID=UPI00355797E8